MRGCDVSRWRQRGGAPAWPRPLGTPRGAEAPPPAGLAPWAAGRVAPGVALAALPAAISCGSFEGTCVVALSRLACGGPVAVLPGFYSLKARSECGCVVRQLRRDWESAGSKCQVLTDDYSMYMRGVVYYLPTCSGCTFQNGTTMFYTVYCSPLPLCLSQSSFFFHGVFIMLK